MENTINYFYNLYPENIKNRFGGLLFEVNNEKYLFVEIINEEIILNIYDLLMQNKIGNFIIVYNRNKEIVSIKEDKKYILFRVRCQLVDTLKLNEILNINVKGKSLWSILWGNRINYYEVQINELGQDKLVILNSIYYYIGLAENAIAIASKYEPDLTENDYSIQHYRMNVPILKGDYYNPNNMLIDINLRDTAEYIKSSFFNNMRDNDFYIKYLLSLNLDNKKANLLFARLMYPTYYFDLFDEVILNERDENDLIYVISQNDRFEAFIKTIYMILANRYQMIHIDWIKKGVITPH